MMPQRKRRILTAMLVTALASTETPSLAASLTQTEINAGRVMVCMENLDESPPGADPALMMRGPATKALEATWNFPPERAEQSVGMAFEDLMAGRWRAADCPRYKAMKFVHE